MKALWLIPPSMNVEAICRSYFSLGMEGELAFLGDIKDIPACWSLIKGFDVVFYIGAMEGRHSIAPEDLKKINEKTPVVFLHIESGNQGWDDLLKRYCDENVVKLMVALGGDEHRWPHRHTDLTLLGCVDPTFYKKVKKDIKLGACFGPHPVREEFVKALGDLVTIFPFGGRKPHHEAFGNYHEYAEFMSRCEYFLHLNIISNDIPPCSGNFKMLEAGYGKAIFLEKRGSQIARWFKPGKDYLEYDNPEEVKAIVNHGFGFDPDDHVRQSMANLIELRYSPTIFWSTVFKRLSEL